MALTESGLRRVMREVGGGKATVAEAVEYLNRIIGESIRLDILNSLIEDLAVLQETLLQQQKIDQSVEYAYDIVEQITESLKQLR